MLQLWRGVVVLAKRRRTVSRREQRRVEEKGTVTLIRMRSRQKPTRFTKRHHFIETKTTCSTHVKSFTVRKETGKKPSFGVKPPVLMSTASFLSPKIEERTQEDTFLAQDRWARRESWPMSKNVCKFTGTWTKTGQHSSHLRKCLPALSSINFKGRDSS